jgi:hypothetical protein
MNHNLVHLGRMLPLASRPSLGITNCPREDTVILLLDITVFNSINHF